MSNRSKGKAADLSVERYGRSSFCPRLWRARSMLLIGHIPPGSEDNSLYWKVRLLQPTPALFTWEQAIVVSVRRQPTPSLR
jgi:hypothetical protein